MLHSTISQIQTINHFPMPHTIQIIALNCKPDVLSFLRIQTRRSQKLLSVKHNLSLPGYKIFKSYFNSNDSLKSNDTSIAIKQNFVNPFLSETYETKTSNIHITCGVVTVAVDV